MNNSSRLPAEPIWAIRSIRESSDELLELLDKKEIYLPYLQRMATENRKREWLSIRILLKELLNEEKEILYTETGQPYLADRSFHISISHTKGYVAVALDKNQPIGIDIEYVAPRVKKIRSRFMSDTEELNVSKENEDMHLLIHWSAKESLFKALGEQNVDFQTCLHIEPFEPVFNSQSSFSAYETKTDLKNRFTVHYIANSDYVFTMAMKSPQAL